MSLAANYLYSNCVRLNPFSLATFLRRELDASFHDSFCIKQNLGKQEKRILRRMDRKTLTSLILLVTICLSWAHKLGSSDDGSPVLTRNKRNLAQFGSMIKCATGSSAWDYNNYGCHCGTGGGGTPVDAIDRCCEAHDRCYDDVIADQSLGYWGFCSPKWVTYKWSSSSCTCITGGRSNTDCKRRTCRCDKEAADCFAAATYNNNYKGYDKDNCS